MIICINKYNIKKMIYKLIKVRNKNNKNKK